MKLKTISASVLFALLPISGAYAAAMDRSGQSIGAFLQPNNYFEAGISIIDPSVGGITTDGDRVSDMAEDYYFPSAALKLQLNENFSFGLLYDQPFGAAADYTDGGKYTGTNVKVNSNNISAIVGFQPNEQLNFYAGGVYQDVRGNLTLSSLENYQANFKRDEGYGWLAGFAFQIPEIALKLSITYRSEIDHELETKESLNGIINLYNSPSVQLLAPLASNLLSTMDLLGVNELQPIPGTTVTREQAQLVAGLNQLDAAGLLEPNLPSKDTKISTPQSVNLDFQTGIMANTVAFANVRWVEWGGMKIDIEQFRNLSAGLTGTPQYIIEYDKDQWSATVGVGRKINEKWSGALSAGWDSGAGNPVTALGPTEGYWNFGLSAQFSPTPATFIGGGVKYFLLGDADGRSAGRPVGKFEDNDAWAYGLKMGYRF